MTTREQWQLILITSSGAQILLETIKATHSDAIVRAKERAAETGTLQTIALRNSYSGYIVNEFPGLVPPDGSIG